MTQQTQNTGIETILENINKYGMEAMEKFANLVAMDKVIGGIKIQNVFPNSSLDGCIITESIMSI